LVTADYEINPDDPLGYRLAFIESFRQWGIYPPGMRSVSTESLLWPTLETVEEEVGVKADPSGLISLFREAQPVDSPEQVRSPSRGRSDTLHSWGLDSDRRATWDGADVNARVLWGWLMKGKGRDFRSSLGIILDEDDPPPTVFRSRLSGLVAVEVHSVRWAQRRSARGSTVTDLVVEITQRRRGYFDPEVQRLKDASGQSEPDDVGDFRFRSGCTLLMDPVTRAVRRVIKTPGTIKDSVRLESLRRFLCEGGLEPSNAFSPARAALTSREPFALLHRHEEV
jgi:hypothetical protein